MGDRSSARSCQQCEDSPDLVSALDRAEVTTIARATVAMYMLDLLAGWQPRLGRGLPHTPGTLKPPTFVTH